MSHIRLTFGGALQSVQSWSIGVSLGFLADVPTPDPLALAAFADQAFDDFVAQAWSASASGTTGYRTLASSSANLQECRAYFYPTGATKALVVGASNKTTVAGTGTVTCPPQVAIVVSTLTGFAGRNYRGRMYLPCLAAPQPAGGVILGSVVDGLALSTANWLSLLRTRTLETHAVVPIVESSTVTPAPITAISVDNVLDTQRRRRDKIVATHTGRSSLIVG